MMETEKRAEISERARELMAEFGLNAWRLAWNRRKRGRGLCSHTKKTIFLSVYIVADDDDDIENTIRHEIAHAKIGPGEGHGLAWRAMAVTCGASPVRCGRAMELAEQCGYRWKISCAGCGASWNRHRLTTAYRAKLARSKCETCHKHGTFTVEGGRPTA